MQWVGRKIVGVALARGLAQRSSVPIYFASLDEGFRRMPRGIAQFCRAAVMLALLAGRPAWADQTDARLVPLFAELKEAVGRDAASPIEAAIWEIWGQSGSPLVDALLAEGESLLAADDAAGALAVFDRLVALAPDFAEGWNKRATTLYVLGRYVDSEADIARVLALEPRHFGALSGLGLCEARRDRLLEAVAAFQRALAVDPNLSGARDSIRNLQVEIQKRSI
jgi:tetratricopeptide (TPR) repeat protein